VARAGGLPPLVELLKSETASQAIEAAEAVACLAIGHPENQRLLAEAGAVAAVTELLSGPPELALSAARALWSLAAAHREVQSAVVAAGAVPRLVTLLNSDGSLQLRHAVARAMWNAAAGHRENQTAVGEAGGAEALVKLLQDARSAGDPAVALDAVRALGSLAVCHVENQGRIAAGGQ